MKAKESTPEIKELIEVAYHVLNSTNKNDNTVLKNSSTGEKTWGGIDCHDHVIENLSATMPMSVHHLYHLGKVASAYLKEKCFLNEYYCDDLDPCDHPKINDSVGDER
tara:strand:- start:269 stop:592 length:324 start_codon:yes stop_codon:yes gene_type:complete